MDAQGIIRIPTFKTLKKYGLTLDDYLELIERQHRCCAICGNSLIDRRTNIDHQHGIPRWKNLPDAERKKTVRGILCWTCNHLIVGRGVTIPRLEKAIRYLKAYEIKRLPG